MVLLPFVDPNLVESVREKVERILIHADDLLKPYVILNNGLPKLHDFKVSTLVDYRGDFETKLGSKTSRIILLRPDAYVGFDLNTIDASIFEEHLLGWKTKKSTTLLVSK